MIYFMFTLKKKMTVELVPRRVAEQRWDNIVGERGDINTAGTTDGSNLASSNP